MSRPIQPSTVRQAAQLFAMLDPRCRDQWHNEITNLPAPAYVCPTCGLDLFSYAQWLPRNWPES